MDCKEFREVLDLYVDKELSAEAFTAAQLHSGECASCLAAERDLLSLRQLLKANNAPHQLPDGLVEAVRRISRPWWKPIFRNSKASVPSTRPGAVWRKQITVSAPAFVFVLLVGIVCGLFAGRLRTTQTPELQGSHSVDIATTPAASTGEFARFDHGGRPSLYKEPR